MLDKIIEVYSEVHQPPLPSPNRPPPLTTLQDTNSRPLDPTTRENLARLTINFLHGVSAAAFTIPETYEIASFVASSILRRARHLNIPIKSIAERIHIPYKVTVEMYRNRASKNVGNPMRSNKEVRLDWETKVAEGCFLESERVTLAFLMSMACYVRLAASYSNARQEGYSLS